MHRKSYTIVSAIVLALMVLTIPWVTGGALGSLKTMFTSPVRWIPADLATLQSFRTFIDDFDIYEVVLISWPGCTVDDERLHAFGEEMQRLRDERRAEGAPDLYTEVSTGIDTLTRLTGDPLELSRRRAIGRMQNVLVGPDGETSCAVVALTDLGARERRKVMEIILDTADKEVKLPRSEYRLAGPPLDGITIDDLSISSLTEFSIPSGLFAVLLCWICLRSLWLTIPVFIVAVYGQGLALCGLYYLGADMNAILIVLPPLVFVLTVSAGVHLVNYYFEELRSGNVLRATGTALSKGIGPSLLAAITTTLGLASLSVSKVAPVRQFGIFGGLGVLFTCLMLFLILPGAMEWWTVRQNLLKSKHIGRLSPAHPLHTRSYWDRMTHLIQLFHIPITILVLASLVGMGWGLTRLTTTLSTLSLLDSNTRLVQDYRWFQENVSPLVPVEVVIRFNETNEMELLDRVRLVNRVHFELIQEELVKGAISPATFVPTIPGGKSLGAIARRTVMERNLPGELGRIEEAGYLRDSPQEQLWRISGTVEGRTEVDYGHFLERIRQRIDPIIEEANVEGDQSISISYTGVTSAIYEVQRVLLSDLFKSFLTALALVGAVMIILLRSIPAGLVAMIPNVFPIIFLFGIMGWMDRPVDIGSIMTASVALGIAVDGTFHFLASYRREFTLLGDRFEAIRQTYRHCGRALVQTSLICAAGLSVYTTSGFLPARNFAGMLLMLLVIAALSDLIILPALLGSPLGTFLLPAKPKARQQTGLARAAEHGDA